MKKAWIISAPILSYFSAFLLIEAETRNLVNPDTVMTTFILKCTFFILTGFLVCLFSKNVALVIKHRSVNIICAAEILIPVIIWRFLTSQEYMGNLEYFLCTYFIFLGSYLHALVSYLTKKSG